MDSINYYELVLRLINRTQNNEVNWLKVREDEFKVILRSGAITISKMWSNKTMNFYLIFRIYNKEGDNVYEKSCTEKDSLVIEDINYLLLTDLFQEAKRSYFKVDETFKNIFNEISNNNNKDIGAKEDPDVTKFPF